MASGRGYLVVGGDSLVGGSTFAALKRRGDRVIASTRRPSTISDERVFLDFEDPEAFRAPEGIDYAFVIAAATNYERCEKDPAAQVINTELIPRTVASLLSQGLFVTFISTNSVFGGERAWPHEDDPHDPRIPYARQKSEGEARVRALASAMGWADRLNIVRLTKILDGGVSPLPAWTAAWTRNEAIQPFSDLTFAPLSVRFVGEALARVGEARVAGNLHLSGAENIDYVSFARALAAHRGIDPRLIEPTTSVEKGVNIPFKPTFSGLGMARTTDLTGVAPQPFAEVLADLDLPRA
ncbi:sugar nucleotide-binding protein [Methylobacterium sp. 1973]|uniref:sugar nucleotide-binding protein n=1 Tax=Methylobacterium sp. 1973 TaxID=3156421 RepID=UPI0033955BCC